MAIKNGTFSTLEQIRVICLLESYLDGKEITYRGAPNACKELAELALAYSIVAATLDNYDVVRTGYDKAGATI